MIILSRQRGGLRPNPSVPSLAIARNVRPHRRERYPLTTFPRGYRYSPAANGMISAPLLPPFIAVAIRAPKEHLRYRSCHQRDQSGGPYYVMNFCLKHSQDV